LALHLSQGIVVHKINATENSFSYYQSSWHKTDIADNATHILRVFSVEVHLSKSELWEHKHSWGKLSGLVVVPECLVIIALQTIVPTHETASHYDIFQD
jgi:hypothetical protein